MDPARTLLWERSTASRTAQVTYDNNQVVRPRWPAHLVPRRHRGNGGVSSSPANEDCKVDRNFTVVDMNPANFPGIREGWRQYIDIEQTFGVLEMNFDVSDSIKMTSVTGYYDVNEEEDQSTPRQSATPADVQPASPTTTAKISPRIQWRRTSATLAHFTFGAFYENVTQGQTRIAG